ncbi:MAG: redoxin domain-containing protein [Phycisphaera sp.]|nr:redoxin domain-containing protein [Phycisphaera sp.]
MAATLLCACLFAIASASPDTARAADDAKVAVGQPAPAFTLPIQDDTKVALADLKGKWVVLYFYPKDDTPGCTIEACDFTDGVKSFEKLDAKVLGCSPDSTESHRAFIKKHDLKIDLLSDPKRETMTTYGAFDGKKVVRSTVIINPEGKVAFHWPKVAPKGHAAEVKAKLEELKK